MSENKNPSPQTHLRVTDAMVDRAWRAYQDFGWSTEEGMRRAIEAALAHSGHTAGCIAAFEAAYPELYWHVAKGKICAGEPLYCAIITTVGTTEIGHGESNINADDALRIAIENAGLTMPPPEAREAPND